MTHERSSRATFSLDLIARAAAAAAKLLLPLEAPVPTANSAGEVQLRQLRSRTCLRVALGSLPVGSQLAVAPRHAMAQSVRRRKRMRRVLLPWSQPWRGRHRRGPRRRQGRYDDDDDEPDADGLFDAEAEGNTGDRRALRTPGGAGQSHNETDTRITHPAPRCRSNVGLGIILLSGRGIKLRPLHGRRSPPRPAPRPKRRPGRGASAASDIARGKVRNDRTTWPIYHLVLT